MDPTTRMYISAALALSYITISVNAMNATHSCNQQLYTIKGLVESFATRKSLTETRILVNYGEFAAYTDSEGKFEVKNILPAKSYIVEIAHPKYFYEPVRVDITSKGKIRARRVNYVQPTIVETLDYPLKFKPHSLHNYFIPRETWRVMDLLLNPMVIMMIVPLFIIWLLPHSNLGANPQR